jgi:hypothetical protein
MQIILSPLDMVKNIKIPIKSCTNLTYKINNPVFIFLPLLFLLTYGCRGSIPEVRGPSVNEGKTTLHTMGYTIQVGAFSIVDNAVKLTRALQDKGFDAYYFLHESNLYKVRFGNYKSLATAGDIAEDLRLNGIITEYMIIKPEDYQRITVKKTDDHNLRKDLVISAQKFLGVPYYWGGVSSKTGFDCSGLTMAVYKLNGLDLPRTTSEQWVSGNPVTPEQLCEGDLVFFSTKKIGEISHVGIYVGDSHFIHAPGEGKKIRMESLSNEYFQSHYMGARTYLQ